MKMSRKLVARGRRAVFLVALAGLLLVPVPASGQWQIASPDGKSSLKLGLLVQPRLELQENLETAPAAGTYRSQGFGVRRARLLLGGKVDEHVTFFVDTDSPNLGKVGPSGAKEYADVYLQDVIVTYRTDERFGLDAGLLLTPGSYNHMQSAATLNAVEYGPYTFLTSTALQQKVGRDVGVQARGALANKHVEYRAGVFQGYRDARGTQPFHVAARLSVSPYAVETGFFYPGTAQGAIRRLLAGLAVEGQQDFHAVHGDVFLEQPFGGSLAVTLQGDVSRVDGGSTFTSLPQQTDWMLEAGLTVATRFTPYVQVARQVKDRNLPDETSLQLGLVCWRNGHRSNLKTAWTRVTRTGTEARDQFVVQEQLFSF
jgi:hypothetical protein